MTNESLPAAARGHAAVDHRLLHALLDRPEESFPVLLRFVREDRSRDRVDLTPDLIRIFRFLGRPEALPFLLDCLRRNPKEAPDGLAEALCAIGPAAVEPLLALRAELGDRPSEIPFLLALLGVRDDRIFCLLDELAVTDPDEAQFCREIYESRLAKPEPLEPFDIWAEYPAFESPDVSVLPENERLEFLDSPSAEHRAAAVEFFTREDLSQTIARRILRLAKNDPEAAVRARCWEALGCRVEDKAIRKAMRARLASPETPAVERSGLIVALAEEAGDPLVRGAILDLYQSPKTRARALRAMWLSQNPEFATLFPKHLGDPDVEIRIEAIYGVGHFGIASEAGRLAQMFLEEDVRAVALFAYALAAPGDASPAGIETLLQRIDRLSGGLDPDEEEAVQAALAYRLDRDARVSEPRA